MNDLLWPTYDEPGDLAAIEAAAISEVLNRFALTWRLELS
jgi:hypothetical protein